MPNSNNKLTQQDLQVALERAELKITMFEPPSANPNPSVQPDVPPPVPDFLAIQQELAKQAATERSSALFELLTRLMVQTCKEEIDRQQIIASITALKEEVAQLRTTLTGTLTT